MSNIISTLLKIFAVSVIVIPVLFFFWLTIFGGWDMQEFTCENKGVVEDVRRYPKGKTGSSTMLEIKFKDDGVVGNGFYESYEFKEYRRTNNIGEPAIGSDYCKQISGRVVGKTKGIFSK